MNILDNLYIVGFDYDGSVEMHCKIHSGFIAGITYAALGEVNDIAHAHLEKDHQPEYAGKHRSQHVDD